MSNKIVDYNLADVVIQSAERAINEQAGDGSFSAGFNGPYKDPETPVRNTSHWLQTMLYCFELTGEQKFKTVAVEALNYLKSADARPMNATFWCRKNPEKNFSNGLVGQAWVIEALMKASDVLEDEESFKIAQKTFHLHPFDSEQVGWKTVNVDGSYLGFDFTFNHQLWFAATSALIARKGDSDIDKKVQMFVNALPTHLLLYRDGMICHKNAWFLNRKLNKTFDNLKKQLKFAYKKDLLRKKSLGYHSFNTYGIALLKNSYPSHSVWEDKKVIKSIKFISSDYYKRSILTAPYGIEYNPPGIEAAYTLQEFYTNKEDEIKWWLNWQLHHTLNIETMQLTNNAADDVTSAARIYEATRIKIY